MFKNKRVDFLFKLLRVKGKEGDYHDIIHNSDLLSSMHYKIKDLEDRLRHLENKDEAKALLTEYKKLGGKYQYIYENSNLWRADIDGNIYKDSLGISFGHTLKDFECKIVCPLRKERLEQLESKKAKK